MEKEKDNDGPAIIDDPFEDDEKKNEDDEKEGAPKKKGLPLITFKARQISLHEAMKLVCKLSGMQLRVDGNVFYIEPEGSSVKIIKKSFHIDPSAAKKVKLMHKDLKKLKPRLRKNI